MARIGLALSGGGARGAAHIGVLQALNENGIFPSHFSGASAGSIIAALYCTGYTPLEMLALSKEKEFLHVFSKGVILQELRGLSRLKHFLKDHLFQKHIEDLKLPLFISLSNLNTGKSEIVNEGKLIPAILASCSIPLIFKPVKINGNYYVDGGLLNDLPIEPFKEMNIKIIGISLCPNNYLPEVKGLMNIAERAFHMSIWNNIAPRLAQCDIALELTGTFNYDMFDVKKSQELYEVGYKNTIHRMDEIKNRLLL